MDILIRYFGTVLSFLADSAPYLIAGFFAAGLIRVLIPEEKIYRHLGRPGFRSVTLASLFGVPLPLCSCSVLPTALSLRKSGASKGATTSFLISTPETGVDSISITYALLDPFMTLIRPVAALITAVLTGSLVNRLVAPDDEVGKTDECECCEADQAVPRPQGVRNVLREAARWAFGPLIDDLTQWLVLGFLLSGIVAVAVPEGFFGETIPAGWVASIIMVVIATPMYICATAATPLAAALISKGLDPGAALVFLLVGPATNIATMLVVRKSLGMKVLLIYLGGVIGCALVLGAFVSDWYAGRPIEIAADPTALAEEGFSGIQVIGALVMIVLLTRSAVRTGMLTAWAGRIRALCAPLGFDPTGRSGKIGTGLVILLLWLSTGFSVVGPGETGWVVRFGRIARTVEEPGLALHFPAPFERLETLRSEEVRGIELGNVGAPDAGVEARSEAEVLTGDENLLRVTWSVFFSASDSFRYRFRVEDPDAVVRAFSDSALRVVVGRRSAGYVLVGHRMELEAETFELLQTRLNEVDAGVRVVAVRLVDVHAAQEVHRAFRDVASALEDKERSIREAEGDHLVAISTGKAEAFVAEKQAESEAFAISSDSTGRAAAFVSRHAAYAESPELTRLRLAFDAAETTLAKVRVILLLAADVDVDLWNTEVVPFLDGDRKK